MKTDCSRFAWALAAWACIAALGAGMAHADDLAEAKANFQRMGLGRAEITPTAYNGIFAARQGKNVRPVFFTKDGLHFKNLPGIPGSADWTDAKGRQLPESVANELWQRVVRGVDGLRPIKIGPADKAAVVAIISGMDCAHCIKIEKELERTNIPYYVLPLSLDPANLHHAKNAWCSENPAATWRRMMTERKAPPPTGPSCQYPEQDIQDVDSLAGGLTPVFIFPNGDLMLGERDLAALETKIKKVATSGTFSR